MLLLQCFIDIPASRNGVHSLPLNLSVPQTTADVWGMTSEVKSEKDEVVFTCLSWDTQLESPEFTHKKFICSETAMLEGLHEDTA